MTHVFTTWIDGDCAYELGFGVSRYLQAWHERLSGETDVRKYIGGAGYEIPEKPLLDIIDVLGRMDRGEAKTTLEELRENGVVAEDADQHLNTGVYLTDRNDEYGDPSFGYKGM